ncbi:glycosyltransferase [Flavobacterium sp.]|uniref:glycosyltransferase family protein n=1 Tax=Flavobacterium sp. TaxID=239 RepID=UPI003341E80A
MRILLVGEFSRLHNSLKEGLEALGHEVIIIANGDSFKNYPSDLSTKARWCETKLGNITRQIIYRLSKFDIAKIEFGLRFYLFIKRLKNYDIVQLINEQPIQTIPVFERILIRKIFKQNKNVFLLCCSVDFEVAQHLMNKKERYSIMNPYFENPKLKKEFSYILNFLSNNHKKTHDLVFQNIQGVICSDMDYVLAMQKHPMFLGLIPNPINTDTIEFNELKIEDKIIVFLGINRGTYHTKGITFFEKALKIIKAKYTSKIEVVIAENLPYQTYINQYNSAHIILDQVYSFDQGYNALEAMAKGKVVFTGAEKEFTQYYNLTEKVAINALPDVNYLVNELEYLIENPTEIIAIGERARKFIETEHNYIKIAKKYSEIWSV